MFRDEKDFEKTVAQLNIDSEPDSKHRQTLRRQMLSTFSETQQKGYAHAGNWQLVWRTIMKSPISKVAAVLVIISAVSLLCWFGWQRDSSSATDPFAGFSLLAKACAAEDAIFTGENIVHIKNEIIVYPMLNSEVSSGQTVSDNLSEQVEDELAELNGLPDFTWLPMCSLQPNGQFQFNQLKLSTDVDEPYIVTDQAWYDPATGRFARVLQTGDKFIFANSFDGEFIYTSQLASDSTLQVIKQTVSKDFRPPQRPAKFLGLGAGLRSSINEDTPMVQSVEQGALQDGSPAHIYKVGMPDPFGGLEAYWLFKVRDEDTTIAENEFIVAGTTQLLIRRVLSESVQIPAISWNLAEVEGQPLETEQQPLATVKPDMVIPNVSVQHMVDRADFETYIFSTNPAWTDTPQIIDCIDLPSPGKRMFIFAARADDGRHLVLVQSHTYNLTFGKFAKTGQPVYTSPNGFKVWGGGPSKWYSGILLSSARAAIKDPPSDDRIGYVLESPAGTFPTLAVNGPLTEEELKNLIDSLISAREYLNE